MATELFRVEGRVIDRATRRGVRGLRVEAWDRDTRYHDLLGVEVTDRDGRFALAFDSEYFGDYAPDRLPDLYYRVLQAGTELANTRAEVQENAPPGTHQVTLEVGLPAAEAPRANRVSAARAFEAGEAFRKSDVRGLVREVKARGSLLRTLAGEMVRAQLAEMELVPVRPPSNRTGDVYNQDVETAQTRLAARGVEVNEVRQYEPGGDVGGNLLGLATAALYGMGGSMEGERVDLYQEDGVVRYVRVVDDDDSDGDSDGGTDGATDGRTGLSPDDKALSYASRSGAAVPENAEEVAGLRSEMETLRTAGEDKDRQIAALQAEVESLREAQEALAADVARALAQLGDASKE